MYFDLDYNTKFEFLTAVLLKSLLLSRVDWYIQGEA
jgi:hypothetical protein